MYLYVWGKSKNNVGWPDQSAAPSQLLPNQGQGEKTEVSTKCVTPGASSKGTWFPTEFCFKAGVLRGVKFLLWKTLSPVDSQVSTRVVLPQCFSQPVLCNRLVWFHEARRNTINTLWFLPTLAGQLPAGLKIIRGCEYEQTHACHIEWYGGSLIS